MILCAADLPVCPFEGRIQCNQGADEDVCRRVAHPAQAGLWGKLVSLNIIVRG